MVSNFVGRGFECVTEEVTSGLEIEIWVKNSRQNEKPAPELRSAVSCPTDI